MSQHSLIWLGHGSFLLKHSSGINIMFDPWIDDNPAYPQGYDLGKVDLVLITHGHYDHIASTPTLCKAQKPTVVAIFELCNWLERKGVENCVAMNKGGTVELMGIEITMVHADHSCGITEDDGSISYGGEAVGFVVKLDDENSLYFAGDTNVFSSMSLIQELYQPNIACLPIGDRFTMGPHEVVKAVELLGIKTLIPMHFGTFPDLTGTPEQVIEKLSKIDVDVITPKAGASITLGK